MAEWSAWWTTSGSPTGHQETSYTQSHLSTIAEIKAACNYFEGVATGYLNKLVGTAPSTNTFRIGTGGAIADGKVYKNDAAKDITIPSAVGGGNTRIDRVVIRVTWASYQAVLTRIAGTDATSPTAPSVTKNSGTTYDIKLYQVLVDTSGNVSIQLDEREWSVPSVDNSTIETSGGQLRVKDTGITEAKLASAVTAQLVTNGDTHNHTSGAGGSISASAITNRTRSFLVSCTFTQQVGGSYERHRGDASESSAAGNLYIGAPLPDDNHFMTGESFIVPKDFVSGLTVEPICVADVSGNIVVSCYASFGNYNGQSWDTHQVYQTDQVVSMTGEKYKPVLSLSLSDAAVDDVVTLDFRRNATIGSDTVEDWVWIMGFRVTYTADM